MTIPAPMSRDELLELAALDAFGLLDEYETALYTRSFHHAPVAVQDEIKELQAQFASDEALLPEVDAGSSLRHRVLEAVAKAIETETVELAPLAMIGRRRSERRDTVARIGLGASGQFWRVASFVLVSMLLVVLYFTGRIYDDFKTLAQIRFQEDALSEQIERFGADNFNDFVTHPSRIERYLIPADESEIAAVGKLYFKPDVNDNGDRVMSVMLHVDGLDSKTDYQIVAVNDAGNVEFAAGFETGLNGFHFERFGELPDDIVEYASSLEWTITDGEGNALLVTVAV